MFPNVSDSKKVQTFVNVTARQVAILKQVDGLFDTLKAAWADAQPDPTGTPLEGHVAQVSAWMNEVKAVANNAVANGLIAAARPGHTEEY